MKTLKESILSSNNASRQQQAILDFLNSRFCDFDNQYHSYDYTVDKDNKGWYVDVKITRPNNWDNSYRTRSNYCDKRSVFDGWVSFNRYVKNNPNNTEGWIPCPEFRYRNINGGLVVVGWQNLDSLEGIENIHGKLYLEGCIVNRNKKIKVDNLNVDDEVLINPDGFRQFNQIRGCDPKQFFKGKLHCNNIRMV